MGQLLLFNSSSERIAKAQDRSEEKAKMSVDSLLNTHQIRNATQRHSRHDVTAWPS